jgi:hypothetical protein
MKRLGFILGAIILTGCAEPQAAGPATKDAPDKARSGAHPTWVQRGNWVPEWSSYVPTEVTLDGKRATTMFPAPGARRHVRDADAPSLVDGGIKGVPKIGMASVPLEGGTLELRVGEVAERNVQLDQVEAIGTIGDSVRVYWTWRRRAVTTQNGQPVEVPFSTVFIEAVRPGKTEVALHWPDSVRKALSVTVTDRPAP